MIRGLSLRQLILAGGYLTALAVTLVCAVLGAWKAAAIAGILSFALFSVWVILTLAAMTRNQQALRQRIAQLNREGASSELSRSLRRLNKHYALITGSLRGSEERIAAAERRMLNALEAHRQHVEDSLDTIADSSQNKGPSA
ncbi:hypothetical protein [Nesterenkonia alkaliphila]|uniref:Uncharacterized protein n=1 Tax=Nesterenkonia alkaliphila TaxID=1463631 RepID=A0A7K1UID3_9MICC|nr:hypothetical protein [Nesterenkonia alkaliphila]MVT26233.1 hypothetical protein [Nesterenkonia alkaliphila]GFZ84621.1 hypothetical protein GCM10011359_12030 [Nesterenkonia alkaliphila]